MRIIDADKFLEYLIFSKHIDSLTCAEVKEAVEMCKVNVLEQIIAEIKQMDTLITRSEVLEVIDKCLGDKE